MDAINKLVAHANKFYALGNYEEAVESYAHAVEDLATLNGPENVANADVMLLYGKALVKLALQKSEVLGSTAPGEASTTVKSEPNQSGAQYSFQGDDADYEDASSASEADEDKRERISSEDDFQNAWEVLDLARVMYSNRLDSSEETSEQKAAKTRLAETYDSLGEVSLENENFDQAVSDLKAALDLKLELYDKTSSQISGAHYMLALALEYCTSESSRTEAVVHLEKAINSFKARLHLMKEDDSNRKDEQEMLAELELKMSELQSPQKTDILQNVKDIFSGEGSALKQSVVDAMQASNDLTGLVRKKSKRPADTQTEADAETEKKLKHEHPADSESI